MQRNFYFARYGFIASAGILFFGVWAGNPQAQLHVKAVKFEFIEVTSYDWELKGRFIRIEGNGEFVVKSKRVNYIQMIREGTLPRNKLKELNRAIAKTKFFNFTSDYSTSGATRRRTNYAVTLRRETGTKTVLYHTESPDTPAALRVLVAMIEVMTETDYKENGVK
jgi:hypothetical protein